MSSDEFDWASMGDDELVVPETPETAVYTNPRGGVVIRQRQWPDDDHFVHFDRCYAVKIAKAILAAADLDMEIVPLTSMVVRKRDGVLMRPFPDQDVIDKLKEVENAGRADDLVDDQEAEDPAERKRKAAAERQRRRREKLNQRDGVTRSVTCRDNHRDTERDTVTTAPALPELDLHGGENTALTH